MGDLKSTNAPTSVWSYVQHLAVVLEVVEPNADTGWLWTVANVLKRSMRPTDRKRGRIVPSSKLFACGLQMMGAASQDTRPPELNDALHYRDGLVISLLAARPLRLRNVAGIDWDKQLVEHSQGWHFHFDGSETKTDQALSCALPDALASRLRRYLDVYRPMLLAGKRGHDPPQ